MSTTYPHADDLDVLLDLCIGQADTLKIDTGTVRVWIARGTTDDGHPYDRTVYVEAYDTERGQWEVVGEYDGDNPPSYGIAGLTPADLQPINTTTEVETA